MNSNDTFDVDAAKPKYDLEYWLNKATDPYTEEKDRVRFITGFCEQLNEELEGPQISCRLLAHKIQSPQEKEALNALNIMEACVRNCGQRFHNEIGKFRFLNEIIKILSPKYLGSKTPHRVRTKAIELLYSWSHTLRHQSKIKQAYEMLKMQGIIQQDPKYMDEMIELPPAMSKPKLATFEDEERAKLLSSLLKSQDPGDLQAANRLIKTMVKEEEKRAERMAKRSIDLNTMQNNARLLGEMLDQYNGGSVERETLKDLLDSLVQLRPTLFRYATEASESDENALAEILAINDEVGKVIDVYQVKIGLSTEVATLNKNVSSINSTNLQTLSLLNLDDNSGSPNYASIFADLPSCASDTSGISDDCNLLGIAGTPLIGRRHSGKAHSAGTDLLAALNQGIALGSRESSSRSSPPTEVASAASGPAGSTGATPLSATTPNKPKGLIDLDFLSQNLIQENLPSGKSSTSQFVKEQKGRVPLRDIPTTFQIVPSLSPLDPFGPTPSELAPVVDLGLNVVADPSEPPKETSTPPDGSGDPACQPVTVPVPIPPTLPNLDDIVVPLESIEPSDRDPVDVMAKDKLRVMLHYSANRLMAGVVVAVVSITSIFAKPVSDVEFSIKTLDSEKCTVKLQKATSVSLPGYNPILPPSAISQICLISSLDSSPSVMLECSLSFSMESKPQRITAHVDVDCSWDGL